MHIDGRLQDYIAASFAVTTLDDLADLIQQATVDIGYESFSLHHQCDLSVPSDATVALSTIELDWSARFNSRRYFRYCPLATTSQRYGAPFAWEQVSKLIPITDRQHRIFQEARGFGLVDGLVVPLHMPGEHLAACTFYASRGKAVEPENMAIAHVIATFAYQKALQLVRGASRTGSPALSDRQIDCLVLAAAGKSEWEISEILDISKSTVHYHMSTAMRRYGVYKRQQLIFCALRDGLISFADIGHF